VAISAITGNAQSLATATHQVREVTQNGEAKSLGNLPADQALTLDLVLQLRDQAGLDAFLRDIYNPASSNFHHYLTVAQFTERFGPTQQNYDAVLSFAKENGLEVIGGSRDGMDVQVKAPASAIERALHLTLGSYQHPRENRTFYAPDREPTVDLPFPLWHISGLDNYSTPQPRLMSRDDYALAHGISPDAVISHATTGSGPSASFLGSDMRAAYYGSGSLTGAGQNLGLLEFVGTDLADLDNYFSTIGQTNNVPITLLSVDGTSTSCLASARRSCDDTEQTLDMTQAISMAPGLASLVVYIGSSDTAIMSAMTTHNPLPLTIGCSWGWTPADPSALNPYFQKMAAQGQTFLVASGDSSTWSSTVTAWPADNAYIVAVGGTDLITNGAGGSWFSETAWTDSGGGVSPDSIPIPSWQQLSGVINSSNNGSTTLRNGPDVSANANFTFYVCSDQTTCTANHWGGTSFAAPMWAGLLALANQQSAAAGGQPVGFINPTIYAQNITASYGANFHDITSGASGSYSAVTGYDLVTGWGSPKGSVTINGLLGVQTITFGSISTQTVGVPLTLTGTASSGLTVSYSSSTTSVCTVSGSTATFLTAGTCTITATQPGNGTYSAAAPVTQSFAVNSNTSSSGSASYIGTDTSTQGTWSGTYGADGNMIANDSTAPPSYATVSFSGSSTWTWAGSTSDVRALETGYASSTRIASQYFASVSFTVNINLTDGNTHRVGLYLLDWDSTIRSENITITDAVSGAVLSTQSFASFNQGVWAVWNLKGNVLITVTNTAPGENATVSGIFFGAATAPPATTASATYSGTDTATQGTWTGTYGADGYLIANNSMAPPSYANVSFSGDSTWTWAGSTSDVRALQTGYASAARIASQYFATVSFTMNINLTDGNTHRVGLYLLDWDSTIRSENITITDAASGAVLNTQNFSNFHNGVWAVWNLKGNVVITVANTAPGENATVSGIFFGAATAPPATTASATYSGTDTATQGTWTGTYGADGNLIANNSTAPPSYATVSFAGDSTWTWAGSTSDVRALETGYASSTRIASQYFGSVSFTMNINLTDGNTHRVGLYLLDWDSTIRSENITITDAASGAVLSTQSFASFNQGVWAVWNLKGNVVITVTNTAPGENATVSGIFFGAATTPPATTASATYSGTDTATQGNWTGIYGADGNLIANDSTAPPAYATVSFSGGSSATWAGSTSDVRALETGYASSTRIASQYFASVSFTMNVNLTDGNTHRVGLYLLDWDSTIRSENITITDAASGAVLSTQSFASFNQGVWAIWNLKGNVVITVTNTAPGKNATVSGIFFN
jgi:kumamolisin